MEIFNENEIEPDVDIDDEPDLEVSVGLDIVAVEGRYGVIDWRGFHPSPNPSFEEEVRRDPVAAMNNRFSRARKLKSQGCPKLAQQLLKEAYRIKDMIMSVPSRTKKNTTSRPRFSH